MHYLTLILCSLISIILALILLIKPLFLEKQHKYFPLTVSSQGFLESLAALQTLSELEEDFQMGKISQEDFDKLSLETKRQFLELKKKGK